MEETEDVFIRHELTGRDHVMMQDTILLSAPDKAQMSVAFKLPA